MVLLVGASLIAILTTLGIVLSLLFESLMFFTKVNVGEFLFGTTWSPQMAIRADQAGSSGAFGSVPLFWGTIFIGAIIAMIVAIPLGLMSAIFLTQYAPQRLRAWLKPILEILAAGGTRFWHYADDSEALTDALRLSRGMSFKNAMAGLPLGGGKAVILADSDRTKTPEMVAAFGRAVDRLGGNYVTAEDVGMSVADMTAIAQQTKFVAGLPVAGGAVGGDPGPLGPGDAEAAAVAQGVDGGRAEAAARSAARAGQGGGSSAAGGERRRSAEVEDDGAGVPRRGAAGRRRL